MRIPEEYGGGRDWYEALTEIEHPIHRMALLQFPDGYSNIFFTDAETGEWIEQDLGATVLAKKVGMRLIALPTGQKTMLRKLVWINGSSMDKSIRFGFHQFKLSQFPAFEIYNVNRRYLYTIAKISDQVWQVFKPVGKSDWNYDKTLVDFIPELLDPYTLNL